MSEQTAETGTELKVTEGNAGEATPASETQTDGYADAAQNPEVLAAFERTFGARDGAETGEGDEPTAEEPVDATAAAEAKPPQPEAPKPVPTKQPAAAKPAGQEATATLDPALKQAALRAKWSEADVAAFHAANPELAERTFKQLHATYNDLSSQYARIGQPRQQPQQPQPQPAQQPAGKPQAATPPTGNSKLDALMAELDKFAEANGEDLTERLIKPLFAEVIAPFRQMQASYEAQQRASMASEINNVFKSFDGYGDLYGEAGKMTGEQYGARAQVAQVADQIRAGANLQGIDMPVAEALDRAHALYTADRQQQAIRQQITEQVKKRSNGLTARPTQRRVPQTAGEGAPRSEQAAMAAVSSWWAERGE